MNKSTFLSLLIMLCNGNLFSQSVQLHSSIRRDSIGTYLMLNITNSSKQNVFVPISHWEIDGIKDTSDILLGFPNFSYLVNVIHYAPLIFKGKGIPTRGDKGDFPDYVRLPIYIKVKPHNSCSIEVKIGRASYM